MSHPGKPAPDTGDGAGDFLARWSRRKLEARATDAEPASIPAETSPAACSPDGAAVQPAEPQRELTDADMPPLETLGADSDYAVFMSPGVSDGLRRLALRKLFNQPDFNVTDGLNDYDDDYTQFASLGNVVTHEMKRMLLRELAGSPDETPPPELTATETLAADAAGPAASLPQHATPATAGNAVADVDNESPPAGGIAGAEDTTT
jgi:hypothetical protein